MSTKIDDKFRANTMCIISNWIHDKVEFITNTKIKIQPKLYRYNLCCIDEPISSDKYDIFSWELIYHTKCDNSLPGFIQIDPKTKEIVNESFNNNYNAAPFYIGGCCINIHRGFKIFLSSNNTINCVYNKISILLQTKFSDDPKIGFRANFILDQMEVFHNGNNLGVICKNIPKCFMIITATFRVYDCYDIVEIIHRMDNFESS